MEFELSEIADKAGKAGERVTEITSKIISEPIGDVISAKNAELLNTALDNQLELNIDTFNKIGSEMNGRELTVAERKVMKDAFKEDLKIEPDKPLSIKVRQFAAQHPELEKIISDVTKDAAEKALKLPVFASMESELADFDIKLSDDSANNKIKDLFNNKLYKAKIKQITSKLKPSSKVFGIIGIVVIIGILIPILISVQKGTLSPTAANIVYQQQMSGCYMIYGDGENPEVIKLDGCSQWYSSDIKNALSCRCSSAISLANINCSADDKGLPFCIGQPGDTSGGNKCTNPLLPNYKMDVCQGAIGQKGPYVYYTPHLEQALSMLPKIIQMVNIGNTDTETIIPGKSTSLITKVLIGAVIIIAVLILGLSIYNTFFQNKLKTLR